MIFVTVGTTHFDALVQEIDMLVARGRLSERVVCQYGSGEFVPTRCEGFRFAPSIERWLDEADLVVCHGGTTVLAMLQRGKRFVAVANTVLSGDHQSRMLERLTGLVSFPWSRNVSDLEALITRALSSPPPHIALPHLADELRRVV